MPWRGRHSRHFRKEQDPSEVGPRRLALAQRRRTRRLKEAGGALGTGAAVLIVVAALVWGAAREAGDGPGDRGSRLQGEGADPLVTTLVFGTREEGGPALWVSLLTYDRSLQRGSVTYIPAHTAVEVPGRGLHALGDALRSGGVPLLLVSAENLLGLEIDRHIELSEGDARVLFEATGPLSVDVPTEVRVRAGSQQARLLFEEGRQRLPSEFLVELLYTIGLESDDQELGSRHIAFWQALFETFAEEPSALARAVVKAGPALGEGTTPPEDHASFFEELASLPQTDRVLALLPVLQVSVGGSELYSTDEEEILAFLEDTVGSRPEGRDEVRVQVLNGNGEPGIGQEVATRLVGHGFKVVVSSNARSFDYEKTLIIVYDDSPEVEAMAEQARGLIGLGEVQISAQSQGIVDLTIVVGKDFLRTL